MTNPEWTDPDSWEDWPYCEVCGNELDEDGGCPVHKGLGVEEEAV